jgi:hypothetical protein
MHGAGRWRIERLSNGGGRVEVFDLHLYDVVQLNSQLRFFLLPHLVVQCLNSDLVTPLIIEPATRVIRVLAA